MESVACPQGRVYPARITAWERRLAEVEARLGTHRSNSSVPPSANPRAAPTPVTPQKAPRRPGGPPGQPPHWKQLRPPQRVSHTQTFVPPAGDHGHAPLPAAPSPGAPEPTRFQTIEWPPGVAVVTEDQGHARTCPRCGQVTRAARPRERVPQRVGPRRKATLSYWTGCHGISKRGVAEIAAAVFDAAVALGTGANLEHEMSAALATPHPEALAVVRAAAVKQAAETRWQRAGKLCWLWAAATAGGVALVMHAKRRAWGRAALLGAAIQGILCRDRWHVYQGVAADRRQLCWAPRQRDFQKIVARDSPRVLVGREGRNLVNKVVAAWQAFREGQATRAHLKETLAAVMNRRQRLLLDGAIRGADQTVATFWENLLAVEAARGTFVEVAGVAPTNNVRERWRRRAVRWRKRSFGSWSAAGGRLVERILTVVQTRRRQDQNVLDYLHEALLAHRSGQHCPKLIPEG